MIIIYLFFIIDINISSLSMTQLVVLRILLLLTWFLMTVVKNVLLCLCKLINLWIFFLSGNFI